MPRRPHELQRASQHPFFGVTRTDPVTLSGACIVLAIATLFAAYLPARRAAAVDPIVALRCE